MKEVSTVKVQDVYCPEAHYLQYTEKVSKVGRMGENVFIQLL